MSGPEWPATGARNQSTESSTGSLEGTSRLPPNQQPERSCSVGADQTCTNSSYMAGKFFRKREDRRKPSRRRQPRARLPSSLVQGGGASISPVKALPISRLDREDAAQKQPSSRAKTNCTPCASIVARKKADSYRARTVPEVVFEPLNRVGRTRTTGLAAVSICSVVFLGAACGVAPSSEGIQPLRSGALGAPSTGPRSGEQTGVPGPAGHPTRTELAQGQAAQGQAGDAAGEIIAAWRSAQQAFENAALSADPSAPELAATTVEPQLGTSQSLLDGLRVADEVARGSVDVGQPVIVAATTTEATVRSCLKDAEIVISDRTGRPATGVEGQIAHELVMSLMERTERGWMLADQMVREAACTAS